MTTLQEAPPPATPADRPLTVDAGGRRTRRTRRALVAVAYGASGLLVAGIAAVAAPSVPLLPVAVLLLWPLALDSVLKPTFRRLALRNISRRRGEAALVILGSLLGTAIITSSFVVGDTIDHSLRDQARTTLGPIDEAVIVTDPAALDPLGSAVEEADASGIDGVRSMISTSGFRSSSRSAMNIRGMTGKWNDM